MGYDVTDHDHCRFCGDAVPSDQAYCSEECYYKDQERISKEKRTEVFWTVAAFAAAIAVLTAGFLLRRVY